jgi:hypothetical protein
VFFLIFFPKYFHEFFQEKIHFKITQKTLYEWLIEMDIDISDTNILWTEAIRYYLRKTVRIYNRRDHDYLKDLPF